MTTPNNDREIFEALRDMHIAANALLYAIDNDIELKGVMANLRSKIEGSQRLVLTEREEDGEPVTINYIASLPGAKQDGLESIYSVKDVVFDGMWTDGGISIQVNGRRNFTKSQMDMLLTALSLNPAPAAGEGD